MLAVSQVINKPIVALSTGTEIERVQDVLFDKDARQVVGLVVDEGSFWSDATFVPLGSIHSVGPDSIVVPGKQSIISVSSHPVAVQAMKGDGSSLKGKRVVTESGKRLGMLEDVTFQESTGNVEAYEIASDDTNETEGGLLEVKADEAQKVGGDVIFVSDLAAAHAVPASSNGYTDPTDMPPIQTGQQ